MSYSIIKQGDNIRFLQNQIILYTFTSSAVASYSNGQWTITEGETSVSFYRAQITGVNGKEGFDTDTDLTESLDELFVVNGETTTVNCEFQIACSDLTTALAAGTGKAYFRAPYAFTLTEVRASLGTAQTSGSIFTVDVNESGTSVLSTKLTIDNGEKTSVTAATAAVISDSSIANDSEITIDIDQIGNGTAKGLIVTLKGTR